MGVSILNFFDLKPLNTSKRALNTNPPFYGTPCMYISYIIQARYEWCQANGVQFVPPVSHDQQSQGQRLPPGILVKG